jgi:hypothetical protein
MFLGRQLLIKKFFFNKHKYKGSLSLLFFTKKKQTLNEARIKF